MEAEITCGRTWNAISIGRHACLSQLHGVAHQRALLPRFLSEARIVRGWRPQSHRIRGEIAGFASHCDRIWPGHSLADDGGITVIMVAQFRLSIGSIAFVSALHVSILGVVGLAGTAHAEECLTAPGPSASPNGHWYYRTDRATQRKCWYQRGADGAAQGASQDDAVNTTQSVSGASADSLAGFKAFLAQRGLTNLSDAQIQQLYGEFLAWRRRPENVAREHQ